MEPVGQSRFDELLAASRCRKRRGLRLGRLYERMVVSRWLTLAQFAVKYQIDQRTLRKWLRGQGRDCYWLHIIKTPAGLRILDPQLELPPYRTAPPDEMFIYRASEIAALASVSRQWINKLANQDRLRFRYYGRVRFFPVSEARRLLKARGRLWETLQEE